MRELRGLQTRFLAAVVGGAETADETLVRGDHRLDARGRLEIYADMYFLRLRDALAEDFPKTKTVMGDEAFNATARAYLDRHPPSRPSLRDLGAVFPRFLPTFLGDRAVPVDVADWVSDLATLEWARADVFDREDARVMTAEDVRSLAPQDLEALVLVAIPACIDVEVSYAVDEPWRAIEAGRPWSSPTPESHRLVVWRNSYGVVLHRRAAHATEAMLIPRLLAGTTFGDLCDELARSHDPERAAQLAFEVVGGWLVGGIVRRMA